MKKIVLVSFLLLFLFSLKFSFSQTLDWTWGRVATSPSGGASEGYNIATDNADNVFITGYYQSAVTFGSYTLNNGSSAYLAKYDGNGNVKWAIGNSGGFAWGFGVAADKYGNSYFTGYYQASVLFGSTILSSLGGQDIFLVKCDPNGNVLWAKSAGGTTGDIGYSVATDTSGNVYITGYFSSTTFTLDTITLAGMGTSNAFIAKYNSSGGILWAKSAVGVGIGYGIAADSSGNAYITGQFNSATIAFGTSTLTRTGAAGTDFFLAKYNSNGNVAWARGAGGIANDVGYGVATDQLNHVYVCGYFASATMAVGTYTLTNSGNYDCFLAQYDSSGAVLWAKKIGGTGGETGYSVTTDKNSNVYLSGSFYSPSVAIDTIALAQPAGATDAMFVAGFDTAGHAFFAKALPSGGDDNNAVAASGSCLYVGGDFEQTTIVLGNDTIISSPGGENAFVAKLCSSGISANFTSSATVFCAEAGACINFFDQSTNNPTSWQWSFPGAVPDTSTQQNPTSICYYTPGTFAVTLIASNSSGSDSLTVSPMITFSSGAAPPVLIFSGDTIFCSHASAYQWYFNGILIPSATDSFYVAANAGLYAVQITDSNGCVRLSNGLPWAVNAVSGLGGIKVHPNPASSKLTISGYSLSGQEARVEIYNVMGEKVASPSLTKEGLLNPPSGGRGAEIDVSSLSPGIYIIEVRNGGRAYRAKFVKT